MRAAVEEWWNDLKRGHFIDSRTRVLTITLQLKANNVGISYRINLMFELTALGAILPSYDVETRVLDGDKWDTMRTFASIALGIVAFYSIIEGIEIVTGGLADYLVDVWNVMDWANYLIYYLFYAKLQQVVEYEGSRDCTSYLCAQVGYYDEWELMGAFRDAKTLLSLCVCIQLFKILKFAAVLVPKMGLATSVLRKCALDLLFFGIVFIISMLSFSTMLYVQLGPVMDDYYDQLASFISLFRALFGDFDIELIMVNSSGYLNALLMLGYLFVAIFIMLSMFLAILAEAQVAVREDEDELKKDNAYDEFGVLGAVGGGAWTATSAAFGWLRRSSCCRRAGEAGEEEAAAAASIPKRTATREQKAKPEAEPEAGTAELLAAVRSLQEQVELLRAQVPKTLDSAVMFMFMSMSCNGMQRYMLTACNGKQRHVTVCNGRCPRRSTR